MSKEREITEEFEFDLENSAGGSSSATSNVAINAGEDVEASLPSGGAREKDPIFKLLAEPKLPDLKKSDRARLQMQSPNRIHFYWSVRSNPYAVLDKALGHQKSSYTLVARLKNLSSGDEKLFPVESKGNWWFDVNADSTYQAEIGFYAPNRPYIRIAYSNELRTPRKTPSARTDYTPSFLATADQFALALDAAGYKKDAFDVALAGDDPMTAQRATRLSFEKLAGRSADSLASGTEADIRFAILALAAGHRITDLKGLVDPSLYSLIEKELDGVSGEDALNALEEHFDIVSEEIEEIVEPGSAVFGASVVNFPRRLRKKRTPRSLVPKIEEFKKRVFAGSPVKRA